MCIIIDANVAASAFSNPAPEEAKPVIDWLTKKNKDGSLVVGGRLSRELERVRSASRFVRALQQAGRAFLSDPAAVDAEETNVQSLGLCQSDDAHIIALARISGARLVYTKDTNLIEDVKNRRLLSGPRGKVYGNPSHVKLLKHTSSCPASRGKKSRRVSQPVRTR